MPLVGGIKYSDEAGALLKSGVKHGDKVVGGVKNSIKYPGNNPAKSPGKGFEWRGQSDPSSGKGNWYNPDTKEKWNADLEHGEPIGPHWDYTDSNGKRFRVFPNGHIESK